MIPFILKYETQYKRHKKRHKKLFFFTFGQKGGRVLDNPKNSYQKKTEVGKKGGGAVSVFFTKNKKNSFLSLT